jgi:hypothetical protein
MHCPRQGSGAAAGNGTCILKRPDACGRVLHCSGRHGGRTDLITAAIPRAEEMEGRGARATQLLAALCLVSVTHAAAASEPPLETPLAHATCTLHDNAC